MQGRVHHPRFASRVAPAAYWSRRELINRSYAWFRSVPRAIRPALLEVCGELARAGAAPGSLRAGELPEIPHLRSFARELLGELTAGSGIAYVSGLVAPDSPVDDAAVRWAYALLGRELGTLVGPGGGLLDLGGKRCRDRDRDRDRGGAVPMPGGETRFHTDSDGGLVPDLVGMLCLTPAKSGGECQVTSAFRAHELVRGRHGGLLGALYEPFIRGVVSLASVPAPDGPGAVTRTTIRTRRGPVFAAREGAPGVLFEYMRERIEAAHARAGEPLTPTQVAAFDRLDEALADPAACVQFLMRRGEMLFIDNAAIAHNRRDFVDHPEPHRQRSMVRMWIALANAAARTERRDPDDASDALSDARVTLSAGASGP